MGCFSSGILHRQFWLDSDKQKLFVVGIENMHLHFEFVAEH